MLCKTCHYSLAGLAGRGGQHRCPECGRAFDPNDPHTFDSGRLSPGGRAAIRIVIIILAILTLAAGAIALLVYYLFSSAFRNFHP